MVGINGRHSASRIRGDRHFSQSGFEVGVRLCVLGLPACTIPIGKNTAEATTIGLDPCAALSTIDVSQAE